MITPSFRASKRSSSKVGNESSDGRFSLELTVLIVQDE